MNPEDQVFVLSQRKWWPAVVIRWVALLDEWVVDAQFPTGARLFYVTRDCLRTAEEHAREVVMS